MVEVAVINQAFYLQELGVAATVAAGGNLQFTVTEDVQFARETFAKLQVQLAGLRISRRLLMRRLRVLRP